MRRRGFTLIVSGPSGAGKSSLCRAVVAGDASVGMCVTTTTRPPRPDEVEGRDRFFLSEEVFRELIRRGAFAEWAQVHGFLYGTTWEAFRAVQSRHDVVVLDVDVQGAQHWRGQLKEACVTVFVAPPSIAELKRRLADRGADPAEDLGRRIRNAREELTHARSYDYLIVNDRIDEAVSALRAVVASERCRGIRYEGDVVEEIMKDE
ncbi:MAG: guanylate kinase [Candidatus Handelsmanbacteria bacterium RIFCSPLOWO2_12_FULL_64_10]|uniref:Guanylate kinase n=1 Tax=Handelsmanbacteria sp. (strain RIFCSPLOWO2_12_FULL_64_10) TaxID=1817868 RepID=A0A1F6CAU1_HANXR|nr:MAG: guanylate kinase [Candidatus Handelsmanbacteria bacterium RIFCSPLOWO2_12_FULL_64_10]